jgi:hypothetical protein
MTEQTPERRRAQRVDANLKLEVRLPGSDAGAATLETINISSSGVYFRSDHFIVPMTRLAMDIEVTVPGAEGAENGTAAVPCEGLVVRITPELETPGCAAYEVAVFFTNISSEGMANLERHIALLITDTD